MLLLAALLLPGNAASVQLGSLSALNSAFAIGQLVVGGGQPVDDLREVRALLDEVVAADPDPSARRSAGKVRYHAGRIAEPAGRLRERPNPSPRRRSPRRCPDSCRIGPTRPPPCSRQSSHSLPTHPRQIPTGAHMKLSIFFKEVERHAPAEKSLQRCADKINKLLKSFDPDLVQLHCVFFHGPENQGIRPRLESHASDGHGCTPPTKANISPPSASPPSPNLKSR